MKKIKSGVDQALRLVCVVLFALMVLLVLWQVFTRLVLNNPSQWSEDGARYMFIWLSFLGAAYVIGEKDDVVIDFIVRKMPAAVTKIVNTLAHLVVAFFGLWVLFWGGWGASTLSWGSDIPSLLISQGQVYLILPVSGLLIVFYSVLNAIEAMRGEIVVHDPLGDDPDTMLEEGI